MGDDEEDDPLVETKLAIDCGMQALENGRSALDVVPVATPITNLKRSISSSTTEPSAAKKTMKRKEVEKSWKDAPPMKTTVPAPISGTGSVWEQCAAHTLS